MATNLKDLIETLNAEDIPTNIFTIEDEDPNVILGKLNEVIAYLENLQATIDASDTKANQAIADALSAIQTAQEALTTANGIDAKATQALENATTALSTANTAISSSNTALSTANTAISSANSALSSANSAVETATNANTKSTNAVNIANSASETANGIDAKATQALENSTNAVNTANTANTNATNAVNTANSALEQVIQGQGTKVYNGDTLLPTLDIKPYVNYNNYFAVNTAGKYGKLFVSDKLTQSWDSITLIFEISDKNGVNNTRGVARYSITYRGNGTNAPGLKVTRIFGDANYDSVLFINYVSTPYVDANSNYFELYYLGSYDGDDARKFQVISYARRSSKEVGYTLNKGTLVNLDEITSIGTVSNFTDIVLVYYCSKNQPATITGAWKFETDKAKFKVGTDVYRIPLTAPAGSTTEKRYILATSAYNHPATMYNPNVFQQDNHIYSNASQVVNLADEQTMTGLKTFTKTLKLKNTDNAYNDTPSPVASRSFYFTDKNDAIVSIINTTIGTSWNALNFQLKGKNNEATTLEYVCSGNDTDGYTWRFDPVTDNLVDLGTTSRRWKNLYIAGNLSDGTNSVPVSKIADLSSEQTITGLKKFDNAKFKVSDNDYRAPLTSPAVENSDKRYLVGVPGLSTKFTNTNSNCYMQGGKLYSNGGQTLTNNYDWIDDVLSGAVNYGEKILKNSSNDYTGVSSSEYYWGKSRKYSSGLIIQWGEVSPNVDNTDYQNGNITFPLPFSGANTYAISIIGCKASSGSYRDTTFIAYKPTSTGTGYMWYGQSNNGDRWKIRWIAIGV